MTYISKAKIRFVTSMRSTPLTTRTTFDQKGMEPTPLFTVNQSSHGIKYVKYGSINVKWLNIESHLEMCLKKRDQTI